MDVDVDVDVDVGVVVGVGVGVGVGVSVDWGPNMSPPAIGRLVSELPTPAHLQARVWGQARQLVSPGLTCAPRLIDRITRTLRFAWDD